MRIGMVGCGGISHAHGEAARKVPGFEFVACCDLRPEAARAWAEKYGGTAYGDCAQMLDRQELDGVLVATWPTEHRANVEQCLDAGVRHVLCEKALTLTGHEARQLWERTRLVGAILMEGFMYRHHPAIRRAESLVAAGEIGSVDSVRACFSAQDPETQAADDPDRDWRQRPECGGGVPYDFACYCVNGCRHFAGGVPRRVYCRGDLSERYGTMNRLYGLIEYDNGGVGIVESSRRSCLTQELQIAGSRGILTLPLAWTIFEDAQLQIRRGEGWERGLGDTFEVARADPYELQLRNFAAVIRGEARPQVPLAESVVNTYTIEALVASAREQRPVEVEVPGDVHQALETDPLLAASAAGPRAQRG
ncbi:MAG: Gfo/Idh/MocA family oxidoreductase [Gemmatimonadota bacterium]